MASAMASAPSPTTTAAMATASTGFRSSASIGKAFRQSLLKLVTFGYAGNTATTAANATAEAVADTFAGNATASGVAAAETAGSAGDGMRGFGNVFVYMTSRWALLCVFMSVLLNRTMIYASLRRPIILPFKMRLLVRAIPLLLLLTQLRHEIFALRCQTSTIFKGEPRADDEPNIDFFFYSVAKAGSFWKSDRGVCEAIGMIPDSDWIDLASTVQNTTHPEIDIPPPRGSLEILWPLYKSLSFSQFVEVFSCAMSGRAPAAETGMTLLEHSLAFAEAEALATRKTYRLETTPDPEETEDGDEIGSEPPAPVPRVLKIKGEKIVPSEVLYIALISTASHITSHTMAVFQLQSRYRLLTTTIFGLSFLFSFALSLLHAGPLALLDFPTVSVVGFIPHLLIFTGITLCTSIYLLALLLTSLFPPPGHPRSFTSGFHNLRANLTLSTLSVNAHEDFYTTLLKLGFICLTAASEATLLNESPRVPMKTRTWLDEQSAPVYTRTPTGRGPYAQERKDLRGFVKPPVSPASTATGKWSGAADLLRGVAAIIYNLFTRTPPPPRTPRPRAPRLNTDTSTLALLNLEPEDDDDDDTEWIPPAEEKPEEEADDGWESDNSTTAEPSDDALGLFSPQHLAALLDPKTDGDRAEARRLARHLASDKIVTRSQYSHGEEALQEVLRERRGDRAPSLPPTTSFSSQRAEAGSFTELSGGNARNAANGANAGSGGTGWNAENEGEGEGERTGGMPACVVCLNAPRTIIMWPCRCLSLCEECRVCLAMKNYRECVTCRQKMEGFSRVYVP